MQFSPLSFGLRNAPGFLPLKAALGLICLVATSPLALAQPDYGPAHWVPPVGCDKFYTTGNAHGFCVIHDMEGYYWTTISYLNTCSVQASIHYMVNGLQNGSDSSGRRENNPADPVAGDITQSVREQNWAWHVRCWNRWMFGTEHEGFVNNPAWYTEDMYRASAKLQRHLCETFGIPQDRNHIIGHNEWQNAGWTAWMSTNWPAIDTTCNNHTDPGQYWDWNHFMALVAGMPYIVTNPQSITVDPGTDATFSASATANTSLTYRWRFNGAYIPAATGSNYTRLAVQTKDAGSYSVVVSNQYGMATSSVAVLAVNTAPKILSQPQGLTILAGLSGTFSVAAGGTAPLAYQWRANNVDIPDATNASCVVTAAQSVAMGAYSVIVSNYLGTAVSSNALLVVAQGSAWGDNSQNQSGFVPSATNLIGVAAGAWHSVGLRADGSVVAWGLDLDGECDPPGDLTNTLAIAAGDYHTLAIRSDGTVAGWGANDSGQTNAPDGLREVVAVAAGSWHSLALRKDGTLVAWGDNSFGQTNIPPGLTNVTAIAAGGSHNLALRKDGTLAAWGENTDSEGNTSGQALVPWGITNVVAIGAGKYHNLAVRADGTVVAWGDNSQGQCDPPAGLSNVVAVAGGAGHSVALRADGTVAAWGDDLYGQCDLPPQLVASGVAAGEYHTMLLLEGARPAARLLNPELGHARFSAVIQTLNRTAYGLDAADSPLSTNWDLLSPVAGNGGLRILTDGAATNSTRFYRLRQW